MDGTGEDAIPYATYLSGSTKKETSTLNEVKQRLGLLDSDNEDDDDQDNNNQNTDATPTPQPSAPTATPAPNNGSDTNPEDPDASEAEKYIGQSLDSLISAIGEPEGSDYENEPETGETGYHYYPSFTVSTTVDEAGNEVVAGVW